VVAGGLGPIFLECQGSPMVKVGTATFTENFATAFKIVNSFQTTPGVVYNSESGLQIAGLPGSGVADTGTRLEVWVSNVPVGVTIYADSWAQSTAANCETTLAPCAPGPSDATLVPSSGVSPVDAFANTITAIPGLDNSAGTGPISGYIVWEITNTNSFAIDSITFNIYASLAAEPNNVLPTGPTTAWGGLAPQAASASPSEAIPTFSSTVPGPATPGATLFNAQQCKTNLLYPFITDFNGEFDSALAVSNTSYDTFGTTPQETGTCTFTFFTGGGIATALNQNGATAGVYTTPAVNGGDTVAVDLQALDPGHNVTYGYAIATCNFQYAHGYAFVSDPGIMYWATSYLALVIPDSSPRTAQPFICSAVGGCAYTTGEQLGSSCLR